MPDRIIHTINGPRGSFLLSMSLVTAAHAVQALPFARNTLPFGLKLLNDAVPLSVYSAIWVATTIFAVLAAFVTPLQKVREGADIFAFGLIAGLFSLWGSTYIMGWFLDSDPDPSRLIFAVVYLGVAGGVAAAARMINPVRQHRGGHLVHSG